MKLKPLLAGATVAVLMVGNLATLWPRRPVRGFLLDPIVERSDRLQSALQVLLKQPGQNDSDRSPPFFVALATLARDHGRDPEEFFSDGDEGYAISIGTGRDRRFVVVLWPGEHSLMVMPGYDTQRLLLLGHDGRLLDNLSCTISNRLTRFCVESGTFRTDVLAVAQEDGARLVIRYIPRAGEEVSGHWSHEITHREKAVEYRWGPSTLVSQWSPKWQNKGLCRVAVRGNKFDVVFPKPAKAVNGPPGRAAQVGRR